jgi:hypothetical protein
MSTTVSPVSPSYVIPHTVVDANPSKTALDVGIARRDYQHDLVNISKGKAGGGEKKIKRRNRKGITENRR